MKNLLAISLLLITSCTVFSQVNPTPAAERLQGIDKRKTLEDNSLVKNVQFRNVGPSIMSGRVTDIAVNSADPTQFYVAYASGGLWYTSNNGQSFTPVFDHEDVITIGAIAVDWKNNTIWIGTGESNSSRSSYSGIGIYKSTDNGKNWIYCGLPESQHIGKIIIDPQNPDKVFVAVLGHLYSPNKERGVYKTADGGKTWKQILAVDENTGAIDMAMDPQNNNTIYASMWHRERRAWNFTGSGSSSGIYKSTDGGENWQLISTAGSGFLTGDGTGRIGLSIFPGNSNIIYAVVDDQDHKPKKINTDTTKITVDDLKDISKDDFAKLGNKKLSVFLKNNGFPEKYAAQQIKDSVAAGKYKPTVLTDYLNDANNSLFDTPVKGCEIYRSDDAGKTWRKMNDTTLDNIYYSYGYYFGKIYVSPQNENKIVVLGVPIVMSEDAGKTWKSIEGDNTHGDYHIVWINPADDKHMIIGNDGGVNITYDGGTNWFKANTPAVGQFYSVCVDDAKPYNVYGGLQDNGVWYGPSTYSASTEWTQDGKYPYSFIYDGDGMQVQVDTRDNNFVYAGFQFGYYARINKNTGDQSGIHPDGDLNQPPLRFNWQTPIWLSRFNQDVLYYGANKFYRSMNEGENMMAISTDLTNGAKTGNVPYGTITTISESPMKFGLLYCGTDDGNIWISKDDGYTWNKISAKLPQNLWISRVTASAFSEGTVYASLNGYRFNYFHPYLFVSRDFGNTWTAIGTDLPDEPLNVVKEDPKNQSIIYVGTDNGLYLSINSGKTFMAFNGGLPRVAVHDIAIQKRENDIVVGTHGRSIYIASLNEVQQLTDTLLAKELFIFPSTEIGYDKNQGRIPTIYEKANVEKTPFGYYAKQSGIIKVTVTTENNLPVAMFNDTAETGLNYISYDLHIDDANVSGFKNGLDADKSKYKLNQAGDKKYYLVPGKYKLTLESASGIIQQITFEVTDESAPEKPSQKSDPGEFMK